MPDSPSKTALKCESRVSPRTASKELERIRCFFRFCVENAWLTANPAKSIKAPQVRSNPTLPFTDGEVAKILAQAKPQEATFFEVLLHSGLRILDAAQLTPEKIVNGRLFLHMQKTEVPVFLPLPPDLLEELSRLPLTGGFYFAVESVKPGSIAEYYRKRLKKIGDKHGVPNAHPHRFRDTFACNLLLKGVPLETVSKLLGHSSVKTTEQHYAPWIQSRQDQLEEAVKRTWAKPEKPKLRRIK